MVRAPAADAQAGAAETAEALAALKLMSDYVGTLHRFRFEAEVRYDAVQASGQRIEFGSERRVAIRRPDRARIEVVHGDGQSETLTFDGARLSVTLPSRGVYASIEHSGTVSEVFDHLVSEIRVPMPLTDLLHPGLYDEVVERVVSGLRVGPALVAGVRCDHLAFRGERVDFQLFVKQGDRPLPIRFVIDYREEPGAPLFRATLRGWQTDSELPDTLFESVPPVGSQRIPFEELLDLLLGLPEAEAEAEAEGEGEGEDS